MSRVHVDLRVICLFIYFVFMKSFNKNRESSRTHERESQG